MKVKGNCSLVTKCTGGLGGKGGRERLERRALREESKISLYKALNLIPSIEEGLGEGSMR